MSINEDSLGPSSDSFWDIDGYKRTVKRQEDGNRLCTDLMTLITERAEIEKAYAKSLKGWSQRWQHTIEKGPEYGTTEAAWRGVLEESDRIADIHTTIRQQLIDDVHGKVKQWKSDNYHKAMMGASKETKIIDDEFKKVQKPWAKKYMKVKEAKKAYWSACKQEKSATNQENNAKADTSVSADQMKKVQDKAEKCRKEVESTRDRFEATLRDLNAYNAKYMEDMNEVFQKSQMNEEKRLVFFKEMLFGIHKCLDVSQNVQIPDIYNQLYHTIDQADYQKDLRWWSQHAGADMGMNWPTFEEYSPELHAISRKEKSKSQVGGMDGIMLTSHSSRGSHGNNNGKPTTNDHSSSVSTNGSAAVPVAAAAAVSGRPAVSQPPPNLQRQLSYDPTLNPFDGDEVSAKASTNQSQSSDSATKETNVTIATTTPRLATSTSSSRTSLETAAGGTPAKPLPSTQAPASSNPKTDPEPEYDPNLNPFGDDDTDEVEPEPKAEPEPETNNEPQLPVVDAVASPERPVGESPSPRTKKCPPPKPPPPKTSRVAARKVRRRKRPAPTDPDATPPDPDTEQVQNPFGDDDWEEDGEEENFDGVEGVPVRALYDYDGQEEDELTFKSGDVFQKLKDRDDQGWCTGRKDARLGLYPDNYAQPI